jgi:hypothetical protein
LVSSAAPDAAPDAGAGPDDAAPDAGAGPDDAAPDAAPDADGLRGRPNRVSERGVL